MSRGMRMCLLLAAVIVGGSFALLGDTFSRLAKPDQYDAGVLLFWSGAGALLASPMWVPAVLPDRLRRLRDWCRRAGAAALVVPLVFFGSIVVHNIERWRSGGPPETLAFGLSTTSTCVLALALLLWPEIQTVRRRIGSRPV